MPTVIQAVFILGASVLALADAAHAQSPTKEYIRLGGRVVAVETPGIEVRIFTNPSGLTVSNPPWVDTTAAPALGLPVNWIRGNSYTIETTSPQPGGTGVRYKFLNWSDQGAMSHAVNFNESAPMSYTATFQEQVQLAVNTPQAWTVSDQGESGYWYDNSPSRKVCVSVTPPPNALITWTVTGSTEAHPAGCSAPNQVEVVMNAAVTVTPNFTTPSDITITVQTSLDGQSAQLPVKIGSTQYYTPQNSIVVVPGTQLEAILPTAPENTQYVFDGWSDGISYLTRAVTSAGVYTARFKTRYRLTMVVSPAGAATLTPASGNYYDKSSVVAISAPSTSGANLFQGWQGSIQGATSGAYTGNLPIASVTMNGPITQTATYGSVPTISPPSATLSVNQTRTFTLSGGLTGTWSIQQVTGIVPPPPSPATGSSTNLTGPATIPVGSSATLSATTPQGTPTAQIIFSPSVASPMVVQTGETLSSTSGAFTWTYSDADGINDLYYLFQGFGTANQVTPTIPTNCYTEFNPSTKGIILYNDAGSNSSGSGYLGQDVLLHNSQCEIRLAQSSFTQDPVDQTTVRLTLHITFKAAYFGYKRVFGQAWDFQGYHTPWRIVGSWTIPQLELTAPAISGVQVSVTSATTATITWNTADQNSTTQVAYRIAGSGTYTGFAPPSPDPVLKTAHSVSLAGLVSGAQYEYQLRSTNATGLTGTLEGSFSLVTTPNPVSVLPNAGAGTRPVFRATYVKAATNTNLADVGLLVGLSPSALANSCYISYLPATRQLRLMQNDGVTWSALSTIGAGANIQNSQCIVHVAASSESFVGSQLVVDYSVEFLPASFSGTKSLYLSAHDGSSGSGLIQKGTWTVATALPESMSVSPASGSGASQTFSLSVIDRDGAGDITRVQFHTAFVYWAGRQSCHFYYTPANNTLYIAKDDGSGWLQSAVLGSATTLTNSQCSVNLATATRTIGGNQLTLNLPITFATSYTGTYTWWAIAGNDSSQTGWTNAGTWIVPGDVAPAMPAAFPVPVTGKSTELRHVYTDGNGFQNIRSTINIVGSNTTLPNSCVYLYERISNSLYLLNDAGATWLGPQVVGTAGTLQNSQCVIDSGASQILEAAGNTLQVTVGLSLKSGYSGTKNIYQYVSPIGAADTSPVQTGTWVYSANEKPTNVSVSPSSGSGSTQTFTFVASDPNSYTNISTFWVSFRANGLFDPSPRCFFYYDRPANVVYMLNEAESAYINITPGTSAYGDNSRCTITGTNITASGSGNNLTLVVPITFKSTFAGARNVATATIDSNNAFAEWKIFGAWTVPADTTPPVISGVGHSSITSTGASISWTTNELSDTQVDYGTTTSYGSSTTLNTSLVASHTATLSGLTANTTYYYRVRSRDAAGNLTTSAGGPFTTTGGDTTPPVISSVAHSSITTSGATITWSTNEASDTQVDYGTTASYGSSTTLNSSKVTSHSAALSGLAAGTTYYYRVRSRDAAGNLATQAAGPFTTTAADTTPPVISSVAHSSITTSGATITWSTNEASDTQVDYGTTTSYGSSTTLNTSMVTSHSATLSGLAAGTTYYYRVRSRDAAGNLATQAAGPFTTTATATAPYIHSFTPSSILNAPGNWSGQFKDVNGVSTITTTEIRFGAEGSEVCWLRINHQTNTFQGWNTFYTYSGAPARDWGTPVSLGGDGVQVGRCTYSATASSDSTTRTSNFSLGYNFDQGGPYSFSGNIYARVTDSGGLTSGWVLVSSWEQEP